MTDESNEGSLREIRDRLVTLEGNGRETYRMVQRADRELFGNGAPGLAKEFAAMRVTLRLILWAFTTIGSATLITLVALFFKGIQIG